MAERRLIDAYDLAEIIENMKITVAGKPARWDDAKVSVLREIAQAPDIDAVEVVRCKDCKCYEEMKSENACFCNKFGGYVTEHDYCSRAKKKEGAENG